MAEKRTGDARGLIQIPGVYAAVVAYMRRTMLAEYELLDDGLCPPPDFDHLKDGSPVYTCRMEINQAGFDLPGQPGDWLVIDRDDTVRPAPTDHLSEAVRRTNGYYPPPVESEVPRG
jgi:hypothetical protein